MESNRAAADPAQRALQSGEPARRHARDALRQAILGGDFAPGQRLVEEELAGNLGVTRASVREALIDLTAEDRLPERVAGVAAGGLSGLRRARPVSGGAVALHTPPL